MKRNLNILVGILCIANVVYKLATCISCEDRFFGMEFSGPVYLIIWIVLAILIFYGVYRDDKKQKKAS